MNADQLVKVAGEVAHKWQEFVSRLSPAMYSIAKIDVIKDTYSKPFERAHAALSMWTDEMVNAATCRLLVLPLLEMGMRQQASRIFGDDLVEAIRDK